MSDEKRISDQQLAEIVAAVQLVPDHTKTLSAIWYELRRAATHGAKLQHYAEQKKLVGEKIDVRQFAMMILPMTALDLVLDMRKVAEELVLSRGALAPTMALTEIHATGQRPSAACFEHLVFLYGGADCPQCSAAVPGAGATESDGG